MWKKKPEVPSEYMMPYRKAIPASLCKIFFKTTGRVELQIATLLEKGMRKEE